MAEAQDLGSCQCRFESYQWYNKKHKRVIHIYSHFRRVIINRINFEISAKEVRVIDHDGTQLGILPITTALNLAETRELDLVEVSPNATPPVCKILDAGKFKYQQHKKEAKQHKVVLKEMRMNPTIGQHDLEFKKRHISRFLKDGNRVKITITFKGRMIDHKDLGYQVLNSVLHNLDIQVEKGPFLEGKNLVIFIAPK